MAIRSGSNCEVAKQLTSIAAREMLKMASLRGMSSGRHARASLVGISSSGMKRTHCSPSGIETRCVIQLPSLQIAIWKPP